MYRSVKEIIDEIFEDGSIAELMSDDRLHTTEKYKTIAAKIIERYEEEKSLDSLYTKGLL